MNYELHLKKKGTLFCVVFAIKNIETFKVVSVGALSSLVKFNFKIKLHQMYSMMQ